MVRVLQVMLGFIGFLKVWVKVFNGEGGSCGDFEIQVVVEGCLSGGLEKEK